MTEAGGAGGFDLGGHLAALIVYALEDPASAPPAGWMHAFFSHGIASVSLSSLRAAHDKLPEGPWRGGDDPLPLMAALPLFAVARPGGNLLTEPQELAGQDWGSTIDALDLFPAFIPRVPYLKHRAEAYLRILKNWYGGTVPEPGMARVCHEYAALFNERLYTEAYKLLEMRWMAEMGPRRELLRGLMQLAVGLHQVEGGKFAMPQLEEGFFRIKENAAAFPAPTLPRFLKRLEKALRLLKAYGPDGFTKFDLNLMPKLWMVSPWRMLFGFMQNR